MFNYFLHKRPVYKKIQRNMPPVSVICLALIVGGVIFQVHPQLMKNGLKLFIITMSVVFCHNSLGYLLGYTVGRIFKFSVAKKRTLSIEVGMQNAGMATVLANNFFATSAAIAANPLSALSVIPCAISCAYHSISGTVLAGLFARYDRKNNK
jgi:BASS family bile acid:Na+ symporter